MKFVKFTAVALFAALLAVGCIDEKISFDTESGNLNTESGNGDKESAYSNKGFLSISDLEVECRIDEEEPNTGVDPSVATYSTRTSMDVNNFDCSIINEANEVVMSFKYGERPTEAIELEAGGYIFKIQSGELPNAAWDSPVYGTNKAFKIVRKETETLSQIVCSLMQIKVSVTYAPDLLERLGEGTTTTAVVGDNSLTFALGESRSAYFVAPEVSNTIELTISGKYAADKVNFKDVVMSKQVSDVKAGQHSKIHFYIEHANEGNINMQVTIRDWVVDKVIPCNVADRVVEEEWKENSGEEGGETVNPITIEWIGYDITQRTVIDSTTTGEIMIRSSKGIKELFVHIDSEALTPILTSVELVDVINLTYPEKSYASAAPDEPITDEQIAILLDSLKPQSEGGLLGFKHGDDVINQNEVMFSITEFMPALQAIAGDHDFHFTIIDNEENRLNASLMLQSN